MRLDGPEFHFRPPHYRSVGTGIGDCHWAGIRPWYATSHPGQLTLLRCVRRKMSTSQTSVMCCGWGIKAGWLIPLVDKRVGSTFKNPRCWSAAILNNRKQPYLRKGLSGRHKIGCIDAYWPSEQVRRLKISTFKNTRWQTPPS